jgi:hypothetical protein
MTAHAISLLADHDLLRRMAELFSQARVNEAEGIRFLAEVDARRLYRATEHPSMLDYCVHVMHMSDDVALRRIGAARLGRQFPMIFAALADGRLHLTAVTLLSPHLNETNAAELLAAAEHKTKSQIELLVARRFPQPDLATLVRPLGSGMGVPVIATSEVGGAQAPPVTAPESGWAPAISSAPERTGMTLRNISRLGWRLKRRAPGSRPSRRSASRSS